MRAKLVVAADGVRSVVRAALGVETAEHDYGQRAVIFNCSTEAPLEGRAFERFTARGPIALLPLTGGRAAVIWTLPDGDAERIAALPTDDFRAELQAAFGQRLGRFTRIGERHLYTLARVASGAVHGERAVLIGDAALRLHPVAGQGFNLALRDVATLAEVIADALRAARSGRAGRRRRRRAARALRGVARRRSAARLVVHARPDPAVRRVGARAWAWAAAWGSWRSILLPGAKALLARQTMGKAGRLPRLARGLRLV